jgi:hypothetical protein
MFHRLFWNKNSGESRLYTYSWILWEGSDGTKNQRCAFPGLLENRYRTEMRKECVEVRWENFLDRCLRFWTWIITILIYNSKQNERLRFLVMSACQDSEPPVWINLKFAFSLHSLHIKSCYIDSVRNYGQHIETKKLSF